MLKRLLVVVGLGLCSASVLAAPAKKLFIAKLQPTNVEKGDAATIDMAVCNAAFADKRFDTVCMKDISDVAAYDSMNAMLGGGTKTTCADDDCAARLAKRYEAKTMVMGSLAKLGEKKFVLTLELVDTANAKKLERVEEQVAGGADEVYKRAGGAVKKLLASKAATAKKPTK